MFAGASNRNSARTRLLANVTGLQGIPSGPDGLTRPAFARTFLGMELFDRPVCQKIMWVRAPTSQVLYHLFHRPLRYWCGLRIQQEMVRAAGSPSAGDTPVPTTLIDAPSAPTDALEVASRTAILGRGRRASYRALRQLS